MNEFKRGPIGRALSILLFLIVLIGMPVAKADILRLRDGRMFTGQFLGARSLGRTRHRRRLSQISWRMPD